MSRSKLFPVLGGRFVRQDFKTSTGAEGMIMRGYDANGKRYVMTIFDSNGAALMLTGKWDKEKEVLQMEAPIGEVVLHVHASFPNKETEKWAFITKDKEGNVLGEVSGENKRVKKLPLLLVPHQRS